MQIDLWDTNMQVTVPVLLCIVADMFVKMCQWSVVTQKCHTSFSLYIADFDKQICQIQVSLEQTAKLNSHSIEPGLTVQTCKLILF